MDDELELAIEYAEDPDTDELTLRVYLREMAIRAKEFRNAWNIQGFEIIRLQDELEAEKVKNQ